MPSHSNIQSRRPVLINSAGSFKLANRIQIADDVNGNPYYVTPDIAGRGASYLEDSDGAETCVILRNNTHIHQSEDHVPSRFLAGKQSALTGLGTGFSNATIKTVQNLDGLFWVLGTNSLGGGFVHSKPNGNVLLATTGWTAYDADSPWPTASEASFMRRDDAGNLYCLMHQTTSPFSFGVMRKLAGASDFVNITTSPIQNSASATAYNISSDGLVHMMAYGTTAEARSVDGGVTWTSTSIGIDGANEIVYSPFYNTWVASAISGASNPGCRYSTNNGFSWTDSKIRGSSTGDTVLTRFSHIEKLDPEGRYLLAVRNYEPIRTYLSEDGGRSWTFMQGLHVPNYSTPPELFRTVLINTGNKILLYMGADIGGFPAWNFDNSMYTSDLIGLSVTLV